MALFVHISSSSFYLNKIKPTWRYLKNKNSKYFIAAIFIGI